MAGGKDIYAERAWCPPPPCNSVRRVDATLADRLAIRDVVETWVSARDSGDWDAFRACWHAAGEDPAPYLRLSTMLPVAPL